MNSNNIQNLLKKRNNLHFAVQEKHKKWTYKEFVETSFAVKNYFVSNCITKVLFSLPQGFYGYTLMWGAYLSGTTFCPINNTIPAKRKKLFIKTFAPQLVICDTEIDIDPDVVTLMCNQFFSQLSFSDLNCKHLTHWQETAYVIFTSGSTGFPKGVKISRLGLENFLDWSTIEYSVNESTRWAQYSNLGFDLSICDVFTAVLGGATLVPIATIGEKMLPGKVIVDYEINFWHSVPSVIDLMDKSQHLNRDSLRLMKTMTFCGEKLYKSQLELLFKANPKLIVYNTYGPTEGTIFCTFIKLTKANYLQHCKTTASLGALLPGYQFAFRNSADGLKEVIIVSNFIATGYLNCNEELDDFKTINDNGVLKRCFPTGDFVELADDNMFFVCRKDSQLKVNGNRVDLSEIDQALREEGCLSISLEKNRRIISFVASERFSESFIRQLLAKKLPSYYLPNLIINKKRFPYSGNGKLNTKALFRSVN